MYGPRLYVVIGSKTFDAEADIIHKYVDSVWTEPEGAYERRDELHTEPQTAATVLGFAPNVPGDGVR